MFGFRAGKWLKKSKQKILSILVSFVLLFSSFLPYAPSVQSVYADQEVQAEQLDSIPSLEESVADTDVIETPVIDDQNVSDDSTPVLNSSDDTTNIEAPIETPIVEENDSLTVSENLDGAVNEEDSTKVISPAVVTTESSENKSEPAVETTESPIVTPTPTVVPASEDVAEVVDMSVVVIPLAPLSLLSDLDGESVLSASAKLGTDKADYAPTDLAVISGTGFEPNTLYTITVSSQDEPAIVHNDGVLTDSEGNFSYLYQLDGNYRPNYLVELKNGSGELVSSTTFTDSKPQSVTVTAQAPNPVTQGSNATFNVATAFNGNGDSCSATLTATGLPTGVGVVSFSVNPVVSTGATINSTLTLSTTGATPIGTSAFTVTATPSGCQSGSAAQSGAGSIVVSAGDVTAPTITSVSSDKANGTYGTGEVIDVDVVFSEAVTSTGNVTVTLETGAVDRTCTFTVTNSTTGTCNYTVQAGDTTSDLNQSSIAGTIKDQANNALTNFTPATSLATNKNLVIDATAPTVVITSPVTGNFVKGSKIITFTDDDFNAPQCSIDNSVFVSCTSGVTTLADITGFNALPDGNFTLYLKDTDSVGNTGSTSQVNVKKDTTAPSTTDNTDSSWHNSDVTISLTSSDGAGSGVDVIYFTIDGSTPTSGHYDGTGSSVFLTADGQFTIKYFGVDQVGNSESVKTATNVVKIDKTKPLITGSASPVANVNGWNNSDVVVSFTCADTGATQSGIATDTVAGDTLSSEGTLQSVASTGECTDVAGNSADAASVTGINIDKTSPTEPIASPAAGSYITDQSVTLASTDTLSTVDKIYYTTDGTTPDNTKTEYTGAITADQDMTIKAIAYDLAGNTSSVLSAAYEIAPTILTEGLLPADPNSAIVFWTTDDPSTSRVVYDTVPHPVLGSAPNYGYAFSTVEQDTAPKVTYHQVSITGLNNNTVYYYRVISHGSPDQVGAERNWKTNTAPATPASSNTTGTPSSPSSSNDSTIALGGTGEVLGTSTFAGEETVLGATDEESTTSAELEGDVKGESDLVDFINLNTGKKSFFKSPYLYGLLGLLLLIIFFILLK